MIPEHGNLEKWARQGVLLLNTVLTVEKGNPNSCERIGWQTLTLDILKAVNEKKEACVFLAWGRQARNTLQELSPIQPQHLVLHCPHPSPYSADQGFFFQNHFRKANDHLKLFKRDSIDWTLAESTVCVSGLTT